MHCYLHKFLMCKHENILRAFSTFFINLAKIERNTVILVLSVGPTNFFPNTTFTFVNRALGKVLQNKRFDILTEYGAQNEKHCENISGFAAAEVVEAFYARTILHLSIVCTELRKIWDARGP